MEGAAKEGLHGVKKLRNAIAGTLSMASVWSVAGGQLAGLHLGPGPTLLGTVASPIVGTYSTVAGAGAALLLHSPWSNALISTCAVVGVAGALVLTPAFFAHQCWHFDYYDAGGRRF